MFIDTFIKESLKIPNMTEKPRQFSRMLHYHDEQGASTVTFFPLFPGITIVFTAAGSSCWPVSRSLKALPAQRRLLFSYCISGRSRICLDEQNRVSIGSGELVITRCLPEEGYFHPLNQFEGISLLVELEELDPRCDYLKTDFGIDFSAMEEQFLRDNTFYMVPSIYEYKGVLKLLWNQLQDDTRYSLLQMRACVISMLLIIMNIPKVPVAQGDYYLTPSQIRIAEQVHAIISEDLSRRYSAHELAQRFDISESSLKNYFKSAYGKTFSAYQRDIRMHESAMLLKTTTLPVADIAASVGYASQGKFAEVFRKQFGTSPLEYRRISGIHAEP